MTLTEILQLFNAGEARLYAAGLLFLTIYAIEHVPYVGTWLSRDTVFEFEARWIAWANTLLTAKRKKRAANVIAAWAPAVVLLQSGAPWTEVVTTALIASLGGSWINDALKIVAAARTSVKKTAASIVVVLSLSACGGATPSAASPEVVIADVVTTTVDEAIPLVVEQVEREYVSAAESATSREDGERRLHEVEAKWAPVQASLTALRTLSDPVATALEQGKPPKPGELRKLVAAYCTLRRDFAAVGQSLPDVPVLGCGGDSDG